MVIFHSYVSLPEGNGFFTPRIVESWMFIPIHSLKIWTSVLIEDWPTGDWLTTDQPHDGGISDFVPWRLGITTNQIATPKTNMEPTWNPYILGLEMFGVLSSWIPYIFFARGAPTMFSSHAHPLWHRGRFYLWLSCRSSFRTSLPWRSLTSSFLQIMSQIMDFAVSKACALHRIDFQLLRSWRWK